MTDPLEYLKSALADRYRIEREIGSGSMAVVYLAEDLRHKSQVAIKVLRPELSELLGTDRFLREIELTRKLTHPFILPLHDSGAIGGLLYYVMPFVQESLRDRLERDQVLPVEDAVRIAREVADAIDHAHRRGIVHRDIKPENILFASGHALVADFGIAKALGHVDEPSLTSGGVAVGTPFYMSPEQAAGAPDLDGRSDLYSLGCVLYEMLSGEPPYTGSSLSVLRQHINAVIPDVTFLRPTVPGCVRDVLKRVLAKDPADRYATGTDFAAALEDASPPHRARRLRRRGLLAMGTAAVLAVVLLWPPARDRVSSIVPRMTEKAEIRSLAVLPLKTLSSNGEDKYFADGMQAELISNIAQIAAPLQVVSQTSVMRYRDQTKRLPDIGLELGVDAVIEGSVARNGERVRVTVMLIDARTDHSQWSRSYNRRMGDVLALQHEIAVAIAREVRGRLTGAQKALAASQGRVDPEAGRLYVEGRGMWNRRTPAAIRAALEQFQSAIDLDPGLARAYAGIADAYGALGMQGGMPLNEASAKARGAALKALELNDGLAEAHATLGNLLQNFDWDWPAAEHEYRRAIELNPSYATAHQWLALLLAQRGEAAAALDEMRWADALDPNSVPVNMGVGVCYYFARDYDEAIAEYLESKTIDPTHPMLYRALAGAYLKAERNDEAIAALREYFKVQGDSATARAVRQVHAAGGMKGVARALVSRMIAQRSTRSVSAVRIAELYVYLGENDKAMVWLDVGYQDRDVDMNRLKVDPIFDGIREDPRFIAFLNRPLFEKAWGNGQTG